MQRTGAVAFLATLALALPAGWSSLTAGPDNEGAAERPALATIQVGEAQVTVFSESTTVPVGGTLNLAMIATASSSRDADVKVTLYEQRSEPMSRMGSAPVEIETRTIHLVAAPEGGEPVAVKFKLKGYVRQPTEDPIAVAGQATQYTVIIAPKSSENWEGAGAVTAVAYFPEAYALAIEPLAVKPGENTEIVVRVKNTSGKQLKGVTLSAAGDHLQMGNDTMQHRLETLEPGAEVVVKFKGTYVNPEGATTNVYVYGWAEYGGSSAARVTIEPSGKVVAVAGARAMQPMWF